MSDLPPEFHTEAEAQASLTCPPTRVREAGPLKCEGHTCGAWRWKHIGIDPDANGHVGYCGLGGRP